MKSWLAHGSSGRRLTPLPGTTFLHINGAQVAEYRRLQFSPGTAEYHVTIVFFGIQIERYRSISFPFARNI